MKTIAAKDYMHIGFRDGIAAAIEVARRHLEETDDPATVLVPHGALAFSAAILDELEGEPVEFVEDQA